MFRATQCSASGESIVSIHHLVYITLCRWPSGMQVREEFLSDLHTRRPPNAHHQESQLYQYIIWYISLCVGGRLVCKSQRSSSLNCIPDSHLHTVIYTRWCIDTIDSPDDEHWVARNMQRSEINTLKSASSWLLTWIVPRSRSTKYKIKWRINGYLSFMSVSDT